MKGLDCKSTETIIKDKLVCREKDVPSSGMQWVKGSQRSRKRAMQSMSLAFGGFQVPATKSPVDSLFPVCEYPWNDLLDLITTLTPPPHFSFLRKEFLFLLAKKL